MFSYKFFFSITVEREKQIKRAKQRAKNQAKPNQTKPNLQGNTTKKKYKKKEKKEKEKIEMKTKNGNEVTKRSRDSKPVQRHRVFNSIESHRRGVAVRQLKIHKLPPVLIASFAACVGG